MLADWNCLDDPEDAIPGLWAALEEGNEDDREVVLLALYRRSPAEWADLVASRIRSRSLLALINSPHEGETPKVVRNAIMDLVALGARSFISPSETLLVAAQAAPDELIAYLDQNPPIETKDGFGLYLADALEMIGTQRQDLAQAAIRQLVNLCSSSDLATRCSAASSLSRLDGDALQGLADTLIRAKQSEASMTAGADALVYIDSNDQFEQLLEELQYAPFPGIRVYSRVIARQRHNRFLADDYLDKLQSAKDSDILGLWRYGRALVRIADRQHLRILKTFVRDQEYPRHIRFWFGWLVEDADKSLEERWQAREKGLTR